MTGLKHIALVLLSAHAVMPVSLSAQETYVRDFLSVWSSDNSQEVLRRQAECAVKDHPVVAYEIVVNDTEMADIITSSPNLNQPCFTAPLFRTLTYSVTQPVFGWALADVLLAQTSVPKAGFVLSDNPLPVEVLPDVDISQFPLSLRENLYLFDALSKFNLTAECVSRRAPAQIHALSVTKPGSSNEREQYEALKAVFDQCRMGNFDAEPTVFQWRGLLASNLLKLMHKPS